MKSFKLKNRALAAFLCLVMVGGVVANVFIKGSEEVGAAASLPGITELKNSNLEYNILEIVPDVSQAAFSWYIGDSEPLNARKLNSAYGSDMNNLVTKYQEATSMLQAENYLMGSSVNDHYNSNILNYLGTVELNGDSVTGGFENNEWFYRYVLDWTDGEAKPNIKVTTLSPENVTLAHLELTDMVIVSGGYYYPDSSVTPMQYSNEVNFPSNVVNSIVSKAKSGMPLILDRRAYQGQNLESDRLFTEVLGGDPRVTSSGVYGSVFFFSAVASGEESGNSIPLVNGGTLGLVSNTDQGFLVTPQFNEVFASSVSGLAGPFGDVLASIQKENASRSTSLLSEEITMARVLQYLISGAGTSNSVSTGTTKETVSILSIQPGDSSGVATYNASMHDHFGVAKPSVTAQVGLPVSNAVAEDQVTWEQLESWTGVTRDKIVVVEMSIHDFVRSSDIVVANYDLVYLGNDISAATYGVYSEDAQFNSYGQDLAATGTASFFGALGDTLAKPAFSYDSSKNDLTVSKYNELIQFVQAGRPVVIAPYLCAGLNYSTATTVPSRITVDTESVVYKFMTEISGRSSVYRQDMLIAGADGVVGNGDEEAKLSSLVSQIHIPTPSIEFATLGTSMPEVYSDSDAASMTMSGYAENTMEYIFKVTNDASSTGGYYRVAVSLDVNNDGVYELNCNALSSFQVVSLETDTSGNLVLDGNMEPKTETRLSDSELVEGKYYRVSFELPDTAVGIVPWKIDVTSLQNSAESTTVKQLTYTSANEQSHLAVLQLYADSEANIATNETMVDVLKIPETSITVHTLTLEEFNTLSTGDTNNLQSVNEEMYQYVITGQYPPADNATGQIAMAQAIQNYDVVMLSSYSENNDLASKTLEILQTTMATEVPILFSHHEMSNSYENLGTENDKNYLDVDSFRSYPYDINLTERFAISVNHCYYTNADVTKGENDCKIIVNILAVVGNQSEESPDEDTSGTAPQVSSITITDANKNDLDASLNYVASGQTAADGTTESPSQVYFQIAGNPSTSECYFNLEIAGLTDVTILDYLSEDLVTKALFGATAATGSRYCIEIPDSVKGQTGTMTLTAYNMSKQVIAVAQIKIGVLESAPTITPQVDLYEKDEASSDYVNLLPIG